MPLGCCLSTYSQIFFTNDATKNSCYSFILSSFEYCRSVWILACESDLKLLNKACNQIKFLLPDLEIDLQYVLSLGWNIVSFFQNYVYIHHPLHLNLPWQAPTQPACVTWCSLGLNYQHFFINLNNTLQFSHCFIPAFAIWNTLTNCETSIKMLECLSSLVIFCLLYCPQSSYAFFFFLPLTLSLECCPWSFGFIAFGLSSGSLLLTRTVTRKIIPVVWWPYSKFSFQACTIKEFSEYQDPR